MYRVYKTLLAPNLHPLAQFQCKRRPKTATLLGTPSPLPRGAAQGTARGVVPRLPLGVMGALSARLRSVLGGLSSFRTPARLGAKGRSCARDLSQHGERASTRARSVHQNVFNAAVQAKLNNRRTAKFEHCCDTASYSPASYL